VMDALWKLLSSFELFDLDKKQCKKNGIDYAYSVSPYNIHTVSFLFDELIRDEQWFSKALAVVERLGKSDQESHSRWFVELADHARKWALTYRAGPENERREQIFRKLHEFPTFHRNWKLAMRAAAAEGKDKYLRRVSP